MPRCSPDPDSPDGYRDRDYRGRSRGRFQIHLVMSKDAVELESLSPNLVVADVNRSVDFYTGKLGFPKIASVPEIGELNWVMVMRDGVTVI